MRHRPKGANEREVAGGQLGRQIVRIRARKGMTQKELAERIGVTESRLCRWERGCHLPSLLQVLAIARGLDTGLDELVLGKAPAPMPDWQRENLAEGLRSLMEMLGCGEAKRPARPATPRGPKRNQKG